MYNYLEVENTSGEFHSLPYRGFTPHMRGRFISCGWLEDQPCMCETATPVVVYREHLGSVEDLPLSYEHLSTLHDGVTIHFLSVHS